MTRRNAYLPAVLAALSMGVAATSAPAVAATSADSRPGLFRPGPGRDLQACAAKAEADPDGAMAEAKAWGDRGGGDQARLCEALAMFHKGDFKAAGTRLEALVPTLGRDDPKAAASLLGRAGWAWLRAGDAGRAERLYGKALEKVPGDVDLLIDRAFARAEGEHFWDAVTDLDAALARDPTRADAYLYRASAHKALSNYRQAVADIDHALELKPRDPEAILLRGNVKALAGNLAAARDDWMLVRRLSPEGEWGRAAADNLSRTAAGAPDTGKDAGKDTGKDKAKQKAP
ncbi:hypothetical protein [Azospirillum picis]|uniref:Tetratricopeptide (TPR) repeat protein n=1 Tax=Azospirillum picis TaxID=488438 RepID=A0ABU0MUS0_9PROT|nr:hypothetical protein [Azospirillum picis]MBP2301882.1 tetratricopeptide (TPR) repeat protein [Azospirillum picis]MDQ0537234.1 tetratricopeptide (TPR) repeat protein [Azospirillum picis]